MYIEDLGLKIQDHSIASHVRKLFLLFGSIEWQELAGGAQGKEDTYWLWLTLTATPMLNLCPKAPIFSIQMKHSSILISDIID